MRKFDRIDVGYRVESLNDTLRHQRHIKVGFEFDETATDVDYVRSVLLGLTRIEFKAVETQTGPLTYATQQDIKLMSSLSNFINNRFAVDSVFYEDLTGLEQSLLKDQIVTAKCLRLPFTDETRAKFLLY
jgi:hypothetical protein